MTSSSCAPRLVGTLNAGSSSIKYALYRWCQPQSSSYDALELLQQDQLEGLKPGTQAAALAQVCDWLTGQTRQAGGTLAAVAHRVVHGGTTFAAPVAVNDAVLAQLDALVPLAPLHQPHGLRGVRALQAALPDVPQVACFDTTFHRSRPQLAELTGLPYRYFEQGVRRYGFHGLSYAFIAQRLKQVAPGLAAGRVIVAHLGSGASLCALHGGRSVETSMGQSALDGLLMGTRCGSIDPGVLIHLVRSEGMGAPELEDLLYKRSGLLGISGIDNDMRALLASTAPRAKLAVDFFCYRVVQETGKLAASLGGLDALVFTGGIGERAASVRAQIVQGMAGPLFGAVIDPAANAANALHISAAASRLPLLVVPTDEQIVLAAGAAQMLLSGAQTV